MRRNRKQQVVTLDDLARHAGVSRSTFSLVLRGSLLPATTTRERVLESVKALGYVYNRGAAALRSRQTMLVGMVVGDITNPFFADMVAGAQNTLDREAALALIARMQNHDSQRTEHPVPSTLIVRESSGTARHGFGGR